MKASLLTSLVFVISAGTIFGQNYQTVQSDEIHYFTTQNYEYVLASSVKSIEMQGSDSVFYSFSTVREDENLNEGDPCKYFLGSSWLGEKVVIKPNGQNVFYNYKNEPITIETQAALGDTFLLYTYTTGEWIKGEVVNELQLSIFGALDSIKIIELFSNANFPYSDSRIVLSKNFGFVEQFPAYSFPEPYLGAASLTGDNSYPDTYAGNYRLVGIDDTNGFSKPTTIEVFDFEIGDEYKYFSTVASADGSYAEIFTQKEIVNKFVWEQDSIVYFMNMTKQEKYFPPAGESVTTIEPAALTVVTYYNPHAWNTSYLPEEFNGSDGWSSIFLNSCGDYQEIIRKEALYWDGIGSCLVVDPNGNNIHFMAITGAGWLDANGEGSGGTEQYTSELVYYSKANGSSCGTNQFLELPETNLETESSLVTFPNPSTGEFQIDLSSLNGPKSIQLIDRNGRVIRIWRVNEQSNLFLDISEVDAGFYGLIVESDDDLQQIKIVKI